MGERQTKLRQILEGMFASVALTMPIKGTAVREVASGDAMLHGTLVMRNQLNFEIPG